MQNANASFKKVAFVFSDRGKCRRSSMLTKIRDVFALNPDGDLMAVLCTAERLKQGLLNLVCGAGELG